MIKGSILAFIPSRGGSVRLPRKNIRSFLGEPIISYPIRYLKQLGITPVVSTEDAEIAEIAARCGAEVVIRPMRLADDKTGIVDVLIDFLRGIEIKPEFCLVMFPTAVFATPVRIAEAFNLIEKGNGVFPMVKYSYPPQRGVMIENDMVKMIDDTVYDKNTQDFAPLYHDAGQFYLLRTKDLLEERRLFLSKSVPMIVKESEAQDVDNEEDWKMAELKYEIMMGIKK